MENQEAIKLWKDLKEHHGSIAELVRRTTELKEGGYTRQYVDYILRGKGNNIHILNIGAEVLKERNEKKVRATHRFNETMQQIAATV